MFDEPNEEPTERSFDPADRAREKSDEFRMHAELVAVFEGCRKFDAEIRAGLDAQIARDVQRAMGGLEKSKLANTPVVAEEKWDEAKRVLTLCEMRELSTNDYHIHWRPGEVMIVRWLAGDQVDVFYRRIQAHFDAAMVGYREEQRHAQAWKQEEETLAFLAELEKVEVNMAERYLREIIREHRLFVLSTQAADEINIAYLADYIMSVPVEEIVGLKSAPPEEPSESDLAWFFKLFSLRGIVEGVERMCFFAFLQKSDDEGF
jgi:hypothetical protein